MTLDAKFKLKAKIELREDDLRKEQALAQFREWLEKQGHITNCRTDDNFLLRFLRAKKFFNANAFKMLETFLVRSQMFPQWFKHANIFDDERIRELYDSGYIIPLTERDQNGSRVILLREGKLDTKKFTFADILKILNFVIFTLLEEEETQIAGFTYIADQKGISIDYIALFSIMDVKHYLECIESAIPARQKLAAFVGAPSFARKLLEFLISFLSKKLRERVRFIDQTALSISFDHKILPLEYGGEVSCQEMMDRFKKVAEERLELMRAVDRISVDAEFVKKHLDDIDSDVGSFRKLEID